MNKNNINSLYELIKQKSREKGRKLKIICDWDECLQPLNPYLNYKICEKENLLQASPFEIFFSNFWEKTEGEFRSHGVRKVNTNIKEIEEFKKNKPEVFSKNFSEIKSDFLIYDKLPFLTIAEDLLKALKEDLISGLLIVSSFRKNLKDYNEKNFHPVKGDKRKIKKFQSCLNKFPQSELKIYEIITTEKTIPHRWEWIQKNYPDFDIFIDDNPVIIAQSQKNLPADKIFVLPDYGWGSHIQAPNIFHVKTTVSDLKDIDFSLVALEKNLEKLEKEIKEEITVKNPVPFWWTLSGIIFVSLVLIIMVVVARVGKKEKNIRYVAKKRK